ncbi:unnamed protein product [Ambrosiozyma monospora]|uniref:Unnamed protein product n=1 Tax=Ambrosiozyma monospora TaxID=43982 RepID=A0ACB5TV40_AMBMO|nr:unnamed protein product [Ambrosiozyma monospora]
MLALHQFDYIFAIGIIFAFLDAFNIGANDVANSFSSSVGSRSLTYPQAMALGAIMEFLGAVLVGSRVSDTIRTKILDLDAYKASPAGLMISMACALVGSSTWLTIATLIGMPVSTTHSITGGIIGSGIAAVGADEIYWGWSGFAQIVASWFIAPVLGGCISSIIFLVVKFGVMERKNSLRNVLILCPVIVFLTFSVLTMLIVWKGSPQLKLDDLSDGTTAGAIIGTAAVAVIVYLIFINPIFVRRLLHDDWTIRWYHVCFGFMYYFKPLDQIPPLPEGVSVVPDYYKGKGAEGAHPAPHDEETAPTTGSSMENEKSAQTGEFVIDKANSEKNLNEQQKEVTPPQHHFHEPFTVETITWKSQALPASLR